MPAGARAAAAIAPTEPHHPQWADIHALLAPVERMLADLVERGQDSGVFGRHLPAEMLSQVAWSAVFAIADNDLSRGTLGVSAPVVTTLLLLGVPERRAQALAGR